MKEEGQRGIGTVKDEGWKGGVTVNEGGRKGGGCKFGIRHASSIFLHININKVDIKNLVNGTNSDFLIPMSLQPDIVDIPYLKLNYVRSNN